MAMGAAESGGLGYVPAMQGTVLLIDDEPALVEAVAFSLRQQGLLTRAAHTGGEGLRLARHEPLPDLILLDLMLPDLSGTEICRRLRADPQTSGIPIIMLTARADEIHRVNGFEVGADDYVTKPFSGRELLLRVRAVLRRTTSSTEPPAVQRFGGLSLDFEGHRVWWHEEPLTLTALEFRLLRTLCEREGRVQSRFQLLEEIWGGDATVSERTVDTQVKRLRVKLGEAGGLIRTIRGVGYRFDSAPE